MDIEHLDTALLSDKEVIFVKNRNKVDPDKYKKNNVIWDSLDGRIAKFIFPRIKGKGMTGIYIDSLWQNGTGIDKFSLYGTNLMPAEEDLLKTALKTIRFHKK